MHASKCLMQVVSTQPPAHALTHSHIPHTNGRTPVPCCRQPGSNAGKAHNRSLWPRTLYSIRRPLKSCGRKPPICFAAASVFCCCTSHTARSVAHHTPKHHVKACSSTRFELWVLRRICVYKCCQNAENLHPDMCCMCESTAGNNSAVPRGPPAHAPAFVSCSAHSNNRDLTVASGCAAAMSLHECAISSQNWRLRQKQSSILQHMVGGGSTQRGSR